LATNPFMLRRLWYSPYDDFFYTIHAPFAVAPVLLVTIYQHQLMQKVNLRYNEFLGKARTAFYICVGILFAIEITITVIRNQGTDFIVGLLNVLVYFLVFLVFTIFLTITSGRILQALKRGGKWTTSAQKKKMLLRSSLWIIMSGGAMLMVMIALGFAFTNMFVTPYGYTIIWFFIILGLDMVGAAHIATYISSTKTKNNKKSQSSTEKKSSSQDKNKQNNSSEIKQHSQDNRTTILIGVSSDTKSAIPEGET